MFSGGHKWRTSARTHAAPAVVFVVAFLCVTAITARTLAANVVCIGTGTCHGTTNYADNVWGNDDWNSTEMKAGGDTFDAHGSNDLGWGEEGGDELAGGNQDDTLRGQEADDTLEGGRGGDWLEGGHNQDRLFTNLAPNGITPREKLWGGDQDDYMNSRDNGASDFLDGGSGSSDDCYVDIHDDVYDCNRHVG